MRKIFPTSLILFFCALIISGQTTKSDIERLKKELDLPASASISADRLSFPAPKPIKIYLAIKDDSKAAEDFTDWAEKWNARNAAEFGAVEIVDELNEADVAAVLFKSKQRRVVARDSATVKIGKTPRSENDDFVLGSVGNDRIKGERKVETLLFPVYSYLVVRASNSAAWSINFARVDDRFADENFPARFLQSVIEDRLKNR